MSISLGEAPHPPTHPQPSPYPSLRSTPSPHRPSHPPLLRSIFPSQWLGRISETLGSHSGCHFTGSLRAPLLLFLRLGGRGDDEIFARFKRNNGCHAKNVLLGGGGLWKKKKPKKKNYVVLGPHAPWIDLLKPLWLVYAKQSTGMSERPREAQARTSPLCARHLHPHRALHTLMPLFFFSQDAHWNPNLSLPSPPLSILLLQPTPPPPPSRFPFSSISAMQR